MSTRRDPLAWAGAAAAALAVHGGVAALVLSALPVATPPPPQTEIVIESIQLGRTEAASGTLADRAAADSAQMAPSAQSPRTTTAAQAENAETAQAEAAAATGAQAEAARSAAAQADSAPQAASAADAAQAASAIDAARAASAIDAARAASAIDAARAAMQTADAAPLPDPAGLAEADMDTRASLPAADTSTDAATDRGRIIAGAVAGSEAQSSATPRATAAQTASIAPSAPSRQQAVTRQEAAPAAAAPRPNSVVRTLQGAEVTARASSSQAPTSQAPTSQAPAPSIQAADALSGVTARAVQGTDLSRSPTLSAAPAPATTPAPAITPPAAINPAPAAINPAPAPTPAPLASAFAPSLTAPTAVAPQSVRRQEAAPQSVRRQETAPEPVRGQEVAGGTPPAQTGNTDGTAPSGRALAAAPAPSARAAAPAARAVTGASPPLQTRRVEGGSALSEVPVPPSATAPPAETAAPAAPTGSGAQIALLQPAAPPATPPPAAAPSAAAPSAPTAARVPDFVPEAVADAQDQARYGAIVDYLRDYRAQTGCFAALPTVSGRDGTLELDTFGLLTKDLASFTDGLQREAGLTPQTYERKITEAQCAALRFVTGLRDYPAFSLSIDLEQREIPNEGALRGVIRHGDARTVHLLLIDDAGLVQPLNGFLRTDGAVQRFDIGPLTQTDEGVSTQQLLLALAVPEDVPSLTELANGAAEATSFFAALARDIAGPMEARTGLGMVAFSVVLR